MSAAQQLAAWIEQHRQLGETRLADFLRLERPGSEGSLPNQHPGSTPSAQSRQLAKWILDNDVHVIPLGCSAYPKRLLDALGDNTPPVLYAIGQLELFNTEAMAIIGTRRPSATGRNAARNYASAFAKRDIAVVSGNAPGVDAGAHDAALKAEGATVVFPPTPIEQFVPSFNVPPGGRVLIASPFPPGSKVQPWCFLRRNSLVAAFCRGSFIAETGTRGGTVDTVRKLRALNRPMWVTKLHEQEKHFRAHQLLKAGGAVEAPIEPTEEFIAEMLRVARQSPAAGSSSRVTSFFEMAATNE
ncbi:MAG: DNA-processing protein DprA [Candidatus Sumerlaeaceae bacterium]